MRIAMLCSGHPVDDARVVHKQAASLAKVGHKVVVFGREPSKIPQRAAGNYPMVSFIARICPSDI